MLQHTFCHLSGIGQKTESQLWQNGILSWGDWQDPPPIRLPGSSRAEIVPGLEASLAALEDNPLFFTKNLPAYEHWRIFSEFRDKTAFIDIETTGLHDDAEITTIALYDGVNVFTYVNGTNLDQFIHDIFKYKVLVSYNGKSFDIPFIENFFSIKLDHAQIDLRYVLAKLGFKGGLKGCEKQLGLDRGKLAGVDGYGAVLLWYEYKNKGNSKALETLLAYNIEDTINLEVLLVEACNRYLQNTPFFNVLQLELPILPKVHYQADQQVLSKISYSHTNW